MRTEPGRIEPGSAVWEAQKLPLNRAASLSYLFDFKLLRIICLSQLSSFLPTTLDGT